MQARAKNYLIILLALSTVTAGAVAWQKTKQLAQLQSTLSANTAGKGRRAPVATSGSYSAVAATGKVDATADDNANGDTAQNGNRQRRNGRANFEALMKDPKFAKAMATEQTARINMRYGALYQQLNLSASQQAALANLLLERQNTARDVTDAARDQGLNPAQDRAAINQMVQQAQAQVDQSIQSTLGAGGYSQYQQYQNSESQRSVVSALGTSSTPLSSAQSAFLVQALGSTGTTGGGGFGGGQQATVTNAVIAQAQGVLSPDQITALQQIQAQQQAQQTMRQMFQAQAQANNNGN